MNQFNQQQNGMDDDVVMMDVSCSHPTDRVRSATDSAFGVEDVGIRIG